MTEADWHRAVESLRKEVASLRNALQAALDDREQRCDCCGKPRKWRRDKVMLVSKPNLWCDDCLRGPEGPALPWHAVADDYQFPIVATLRAALGQRTPHGTLASKGAER